MKAQVEWPPMQKQKQQLELLGGWEAGAWGLGRNAPRMQHSVLVNHPLETAHLLMHSKNMVSMVTLYSI